MHNELPSDEMLRDGFETAQPINHLSIVQVDSAAKRVEPCAECLIGHLISNEERLVLRVGQSFKK